MPGCQAGARMPASFGAGLVKIGRQLDRGGVADGRVDRDDRAGLRVGGQLADDTRQQLENARTKAELLAEIVRLLRSGL